MKNLLRFVGALVAVMAWAVPSYAQTTVTQTTASAAITQPSPGAPGTVITVASATNIAVGTELFVDEEAMLVTAQLSPVTVLQVQRGYDGTTGVAHPNASVVYAGPTSGTLGSPFVFDDPPIGACTLSAEPYSLRINVTNGHLSQCTNSVWLNVVDGFQFVPAMGACASQTANATGTNGLTVAGASNTSVIQAQSTVTGTNTHNYVCHIPIPSRLNATRGSYLVDAQFFYGVQTTGLGTQVATLASGTMNSVLVFSSITMPVSGASETPSTVTPVRLDTGTLLITPVVGSFNVATTTAGAFDSVKFTPSVPIALTTDLVDPLLSVSLLNTATSATITNTPGFLVHYRYFTER